MVWMRVNPVGVVDEKKTKQGFKNERNVYTGLTS